MPSPSIQVRVKYALDRLVAAALLVLLSPAGLLISLLIKLDSRGPIFFCQRRVGLRGRLFTIYKFRSMVNDADALLDECGRPRASRVSRVGYWLRRLSLDELPQLLNILRGEMSFIGPRPGPAERHQRCTSWQQRRCEMRPGITGLAQVSGRNKIPWSRRVELDIQYVDAYSWWLDLRILLRTVWTVLTGSGMVMDRNPNQVDDIVRSTAGNKTVAANSAADQLLRRIEPRLIGHYRKDASYESFLQALNHALAGSHDAELRDLPERFSTIHVIGVPRSGSTLISQLISSCFDVGYINHLTASFWRVPCYGIRLSEKLLPGVRPDSFHSDFGRTSTIGEPHEFGYFWSYLLGYPEMAEQGDGFERTINWQRLRLVLTNMTHAFNKPVVFKSFLLAWHIGKLQETLPKSIVIWIRRDPAENALSLLKARQAQLGSVEKWVSMKPREFHWLQHQPVWTQVAGQVFYIERAIARQVDQLNGRNVIQIAYEDLCANPRSVLEDLRRLLAQNGQEVRQVAEPPSRFDARSNQSAGHPLCDRVKAAIEDLYQGGDYEKCGFRHAG